MIRYTTIKRWTLTTGKKKLKFSLQYQKVGVSIFCFVLIYFKYNMNIIKKYIIFVEFSMLIGTTGQLVDHLTIWEFVEFPRKL